MRGKLRYSLMMLLPVLFSCSEAQIVIPELVAELSAPCGSATRSCLPSGIEDRIVSVTWAAYRSDSGTLEFCDYLEPGASGACRLSGELPAGRSYDIFAIVNMGDCRNQLPAGSDGMQTFSLLLPEDFADVADTGLPMCGCVSGASPGSTVWNIPLRCMMAKYLLRVNLRGLDLQLSDSQWQNVMQGRYMRVARSNRHLVPFSENGSSARSADDTAAGDYESSFSAIIPAGSASSSMQDRIFTYELFVPENMQGVLLPENDDPRLKSYPEVDRIHGASVAGCLTYLEFSFDKTIASDYNPFTGDIIYRIYLGRDNCTDFNIEGGTLNELSVDFDSSSLLDPPQWKVEHGTNWNNDAEYLEFSTHDLNVTQGSESSLFVWYDGSGHSLQESIPLFMGWPAPDRVVAAVRDEWYFEEDCGDGMISFSDLWESDPVERKHGDAVRFVATSDDILYHNRDRVGRYYFKALPELVGSTAMLVVRDRWGIKRDTCYVHFCGRVTMNSSDFNNFHVAQERQLEVEGLPYSSEAEAEVVSGCDCVELVPVTVSGGDSVRTWRVRGLKDGVARIRISAGDSSSEFTLTVKPVYLNLMYLRGGYDCSLDGTSVTDTYAYYADSLGRSELSQSSFVPELRTSLLAPSVSLEGEYSPLLGYVLQDRRLILRLASYSNGSCTLDHMPERLTLGRVSIAPAYSPGRKNYADVRLKEYRSYDPMGLIGALYDASAYESRVDAVIPGALHWDYRSHIETPGGRSFRMYAGTPLVKRSGVGNQDMWSVRLYDSNGKECTSVSVGGIFDTDIWSSADPEGQCAGNLTARLCVTNRNSGEVFMEDLFSLSVRQLVCVAGGYCNEIGIYGRSSFFECPVSDRPETYYSSISGATDWKDPMVLMQAYEWNSYARFGSKIRNYLTLAGDFQTCPANLIYGKTRFELSSGLCFDTYADYLGSYSGPVMNALNYLHGRNIISGTVESRASYVEFDSTASTSIALLKFHPALYFSLLGYHQTKGRQVSDVRKRPEVASSEHYEGVDDYLLPLSGTTAYAMGTQVQHIFYGDVEDGRCNNLPWRVDFHYLSPSSLPVWYGDENIHIPYSPDGDSTIPELIGQFAPELCFSPGANVSGLSVQGNCASYCGYGADIKLFFLHDAVSLPTDRLMYSWLNAY